MATRAFIWAPSPGGGSGYRGVYLHNGGYPEDAGAILREHYGTQERAQALLAHAHDNRKYLSALGSGIEGEDAETPSKAGEDRGDSEGGCVWEDGDAAFLPEVSADYAIRTESKEWDFQYMYVFDKHGWETIRNPLYDNP